MTGTLLTANFTYLRDVHPIPQKIRRVVTSLSYLLHTNNQALQYGWANALYGNPRELGLDIRYNFF